MLGREAYHNPYLLAEVDQQLFSSTAPVISRAEALAQLRPYIAAHLATGGAMHHVTRHVLGLGTGFPGARRFRQLLSVDIHKASDPLALLDIHVLPTSGTARFSSPLGVYDFQKRSSIIFCSPQGASELGKTASVLARGESLSAHARSAEYRIVKGE